MLYTPLYLPFFCFFVKNPEVMFISVKHLFVGMVNVGSSMVGGSSVYFGKTKGSLAYVVNIHGAKDADDFYEGMGIAIDKVLSAVRDLRPEAKKQDVNNIQHALLELLKNAYLHGNQKMPSRKVCLNLYAFPEGILYMRIIDEGDGFDISSADTPQIVSDEHFLDDMVDESFPQTVPEKGMGIYCVKSRLGEQTVGSRQRKGAGEVYIFLPKVGVKDSKVISPCQPVQYA
jgi:anti-sigma regulatory factor (Ser/Thr protein kinase)